MAVRKDFEEEEKTAPGIALEDTGETTDPGIAPILKKKSEIRQTPQKPAPGQATPAVKMPDLGSINEFMRDPEITEIMVNDVRNVMIEKRGKLMFSGFCYQGIDELNRLVRTILDITGRILSPDQPYVDVMLPDGSRVNIVGSPVTIYGPCVTIRKFPLKKFTINDLIAVASLDQRMAYFLNACVIGRINMLISGGTGSGKTTLLNILSNFIPKGERIVMIEDTPELVLGHANSVRMQTKPQTPMSPAVSARELVANSLRMRPDRIIVGECRRAEAMDMLQAMNTGHEGSMTTIHANNPRDALARLETLCMLAGTELPLLAIRKQISSAIDLVVQIRRFRGGERKVVSIVELTGMEADIYTLQDIFKYEVDMSAPVTASGSTGKFICTGLVPTFMERMREHGIEMPKNFFA